MPIEMVIGISLVCIAQLAYIGLIYSMKIT